MNQKFYTMEESLLEKSTDSPKPKIKRLARASPQVPAAVSSGQDIPVSQRFYTDIPVNNSEYGERDVTENSPTAEYPLETSSFIDASRSVDSSMPDATAKRTNRWVYSANAPRKGDTQFNVDRSKEPFLPEGAEKSYLPDEVEDLGFGISTAESSTSKPHDGKQKYGKIQGKEAITENGYKPRSTAQISKDGKTQPEPQKSKVHLILHTAEDAAHQRIREDEEDNLGLQAAHETEQAMETVWQHGGHAVESWKYRLEQAGQKKDAAREVRSVTVDYGTSNPSSKSHQRKNLKRRYIKEHRGQKSAGKAARKTSEYAEAAAEKAGKFTANHKHWFVILALGFLLVYVANSVTGCTPILGGVMDVVALSTYPTEEADVRAAERVYLDMEKTLQDEIDHPEKYHPGCDEYYVTADKLWHDPYALISLISAYGRGEEWTVNSAYPTIEMLFHWQYDKKVSIHTETRHRTVTVNGETSIVSYTVRICSITVKNKNLSHAPMYIMDEERVSMYSLYMATLGNMPHVFAGQAYASTIKEPVKYDVPQETLDADPKFAALVKEANKYLGYPYLWGGHHPNTGFDCAGFIYLIFNNSGVASFGHQGAQGLYDSSRKVSPDNARPGDVIFFSGTIEGESGITHCGLYVGNNRMIHCGNVRPEGRKYDYAGNFSDPVTLDNPYYLEPTPTPKPTKKPAATTKPVVTEAPTATPKPTQKPSGGGSGTATKETETDKATKAPSVTNAPEKQESIVIVVTPPPTEKPAPTPTPEIQYVPLGPGQPFTQHGNMATRDVLYSASTNKQFISVQSRNGQTYYMVIDYDKPIDEANEIYETYFLNMVDDRDLMSVLTDEEIVPTPTPQIIYVTPEPTAAPQPTQQPAEPEKKKTDSSAVLLLLLIVLLAGGGFAAWYFMNQKKNTVPQLPEYDEDEFEMDESEEDKDSSEEE